MPCRDANAHALFTEPLPTGHADRLVDRLVDRLLEHVGQTRARGAGEG